MKRVNLPQLSAGCMVLLGTLHLFGAKLNPTFTGLYLIVSGLDFFMVAHRAGKEDGENEVHPK